MESITPLAQWGGELGDQHNFGSFWGPLRSLPT